MHAIVCIIVALVATVAAKTADEVERPGCMRRGAVNFDAAAQVHNSSCTFPSWQLTAAGGTRRIYETNSDAIAFELRCPKGVVVDPVRISIREAPGADVAIPDQASRLPAEPNSDFDDADEYGSGLASSSSPPSLWNLEPSGHRFDLPCWLCLPVPRDWSDAPDEAQGTMFASESNDVNHWEELDADESFVDHMNGLLCQQVHGL